MPLYESTFIVRQDMSPQDVEKIAEKISNLIKDKGGRTFKYELWGLRNLAYKLSKSRKGYYVMLNFFAEADFISELFREYKLNQDILRHLTITVEKLSKHPSPIAKRDDKVKVVELEKIPAQYLEAEIIKVADAA